MGASFWTESVCDDEDVKVCSEIPWVPSSATEIQAQVVVRGRMTWSVLPLLFLEVGRGPWTHRESAWGHCGLWPQRSPAPARRRVWTGLFSIDVQTAAPDRRLHHSVAQGRREAEVRWARLGAWEAPVSLVQGHVPEEGSGMKVNQPQLPWWTKGVNGTLTQGGSASLQVSGEWIKSRLGWGRGRGEQ